jgi:hypothetical protein
MLDVNQLREKGCLQPGWSGACQWTNANEVASSIEVRAEAERLHLSYKVRVGDGKWEDMVETIPLVHLRCRLGGSRVYFNCPGPKVGTECGRRITKLYLSHRYFLCRHCNQLAYASQFETPWQRAIRRVNTLKQRLGMDVGIAEPFPHKPKGMWARTYGFLLHEIFQAEMLADEAQANILKRFAQVKDD